MGKKGKPSKVFNNIDYIYNVLYRVFATHGSDFDFFRPHFELFRANTAAAAKSGRALRGTGHANYLRRGPESVVRFSPAGG